MSEKLFEITTDHLDTGLRGFPVGTCNTSTVDPTKGLFYVGQPVDRLSERTPEEVIYLLYHGKEPSKEELQAFKEDLNRRAPCSPKTLESIRQLPREGHPMSQFAAAILILGMIEGKDNYQEDCLNLIAKIPAIAATVINTHAGWGVGNPSNPSLGYMENFTHMLNVPQKDSKALNEVFRLFDILHFDHGGGNLSTFVGKCIASGLEDMYGSMAGAMCALAGPRHGRANQEALEFLEEGLRELGGEATSEKVRSWLQHKLDTQQTVFGFGHAVLRVEDPRAAVLYKAAEKLYPNDPHVRLATIIRAEGPKVLSQNPKISDPYPNVDAISGTLLMAAGFKYPEYYTVLFGLSRVVGIAIQVVYERVYAREGKGTPIVRPKYVYKPRN